MWWCIGPALAAPVYFGVEWQPLSRADLSWLDDGRTTGLAVGEFDGVVSPATTAFVGSWLTPRWALQGTLGVARLQNTTWVGDVWEQRHWGVIRPGMSVRYALARRPEPTTPPAIQWPIPWLTVGGYGDLPSVRETSNAYDEDEQALADEAATADRARLAGFGGQFGAGVDWWVHPALSLGVSYTLGVHRGLFLGDDQAVVSTWVAAEAGLLATFHWPGRTQAEPASSP
jgi:hypothetical protein